MQIVTDKKHIRFFFKIKNIETCVYIEFHSSSSSGVKADKKRTFYREREKIIKDLNNYNIFEITFNLESEIKDFFIFLKGYQFGSGIDLEKHFGKSLFKTEQSIIEQIRERRHGIEKNEELYRMTSEITSDM